VEKQEIKTGTLYIVATPIGNLEDITLRALRILKEVDCIAAEDTRHTLKLLNHYEITKPLISYHRHNEENKSAILYEKLQKGENIALVSDAGTPGICDPGEVMIQKCIEDDINVVPIPGACAMINALICSGLSTEEFLFLGFLPLHKKLRKEKIEMIQKSNQTIILYEAPHKLKTTLQELAPILEKRKMVLAKEITKIHEEFIRGTAEELLTSIEQIKGEFVLLIEGSQEKEDEKKDLTTISLEEHYQYYHKQGIEKKEIIKKIAKDRKVNKNEIYQYFLTK
jgi:16S rRNA (cytidine1402-2'-O)-methyltransferase